MPRTKERSRRVFTWSSAQLGSQGKHGRVRLFPRLKVEWHRYRHSGSGSSVGRRHVLQVSIVYDERRPE